MIYQKSTIDKIKEVYPLRTDLVELAEAGSMALTNMLDELSQEIFTAFDICKAFDSSRKEELRNLYDRAKSSMRREEVYNAAMEDLYQSFSPDNTDERGEERRTAN